MKKVLSVVLLITIIICCSACGNNKELESSNTSTEHESSLNSSTESQDETTSQNDKETTSSQTSESTHSHSELEKNATCISPKYCSICNAKIGDHFFDQGICIYCNKTSEDYKADNNQTGENDSVEKTGLGNVLIFGDSYSTFEGYIPQGYAAYYKTYDGTTDVRSVTQTWWYQVVEETGSKLLLNDSWSGSTVCYTGYDNRDCSKSSSFIYRLRKLIENGYFTANQVDTIFVYGGTNDSWAGSPLGDEMYENWTEADLYNALPAIAYFLKTLKDAAPNANIYCLLNAGLKQQITTVMEKSCQKYGITLITIDGINKKSGHPTIKGMQEIKDIVLQVVDY